MLPVLMLAAGIGYAGKIYWGYAKGRQEYRDLQNEYTSVYAGDEDYAPVVVLQDKEENEGRFIRKIGRHFVNPRKKVGWVLRS